MPTLRVAAALTFVTLLTATPLHAQQGTSEIAGKVTDEQGAVLPGRHHRRHQRRDRPLPRDHEQRGRQLLRVAARARAATRSPPSSPGFRTLERQRPGAARSATRMTINVTLPLGALEETVTVTGQSPLVDTTERQGRRQRRHRRAEPSCRR